MDSGKGMSLGNRGRGVGGSISRGMGGRVQRGLGSIVEGLTMGLECGRSDNGAARTMAGESSMLKPKVGGADEFGGTGGFKLRDLGSLRGPDMVCTQKA